MTKEANDILEEAVNEVYRQYENEHSMEWSRYLHPMFYNGTFSEGNKYQPPKPLDKLTKEDFIDKLNNGGLETKWEHAVMVLFIYISKQLG